MMRENVNAQWRIAARPDGNFRMFDFDDVDMPIPTPGDGELRPGPTTIGLLSDLVFGEQNIRYAAALVPMLYGLPVMLTMRATRRHYRAVMAARSQS